MFSPGRPPPPHKARSAFSERASPPPHSGLAGLAARSSLPRRVMSAGLYGPFMHALQDSPYFCLAYVTPQARSRRRSAPAEPISGQYGRQPTSRGPLQPRHHPEHAAQPDALRVRSSCTPGGAADRQGPLTRALRPCSAHTVHRCRPLPRRPPPAARTPHSPTSAGVAAEKPRHSPDCQSRRTRHVSSDAPPRPRKSTHPARARPQRAEAAVWPAIARAVRRPQPCHATLSARAARARHAVAAPANVTRGPQRCLDRENGQEAGRRTRAPGARRHARGWAGYKLHILLHGAGRRAVVAASLLSLCERGPEPPRAQRTRRKRQGRAADPALRTLPPPSRPLTAFRASLWRSSRRRGPGVMG